jgi:predicted O-methyltransferase YrrM
MTMKDLVRRIVQLVARYSEAAHRNRRNCEIVLSAAMSEAGLPAIRYPVAYVQFLRECLDATNHRVTEVKKDSQPETTVANKRFDTLVQVLSEGLPAIEFSIAKDIALMADQIRGRREAIEAEFWAGDVGLHFSVASSLGEKGRILFNVARLMRSERCLEIGTAYGASALFILSALKKSGTLGHLMTIEGFEPQFSIASAMLDQRYGDTVCCKFGLSKNVLPEVTSSLGKIDLMFHDAGHSREDYVRDFGHVVEILAPGAVVLFDDIRWQDSKWSQGSSDTYHGWREVIAHPRVRRAVEIDDLVGLLLMR